MAATSPAGTAVYITETGHVLAVVTSGAFKPTVEDLTGGDHLRVRVPNEPAYVNVPVALLSAKQVDVTPDILDRPHRYVFNDGAVPLSPGLDPQYDVTLPPGGGATAAGKKLLVIWQTPDQTIPDDMTMDASGNLPTLTAPQDATAQIVAWEGGALYVNPIP
jgi:hypothetical protein